MPTDRDRLIERETFLRDGPAPLFVRQAFVREVGGAGPRLVVLHGGPDFDHRYLVPDTDQLAGSFRLLYYDQRGRGRSVPADPGDITMATEVEDLDRVIGWTGERSVAVLGHSWGGLLAMEYAIRHPERVSHLILMNTAPASHAGLLAMKHELTARRSSDDVRRMDEIRSGPAYRRGDIAADLEYHRVHFRRALHDPDRLADVLRRLRSGVTEAGIVVAREIEQRLYDDTWLRDDYDLTPGLRELTVPTLVIHGESDFVPVSEAAHIASSIPGARLVVLPECGHFASLEQPEAVRSCVEGVLAPT